MIKKITDDTIKWATKIIVNNRQSLPHIYKNPTPSDLVNAQQYYLGKQGALYVLTEQSKVVGIIGRRVYKPRFDCIDKVFGLSTGVMEVVHLYIDTKKRRQGLATQLFESLKQDAKNDGVQKLYLHTHPMLLNAQQFWEKQGFGVIGAEVIGGMPTIHMLMILSNTQ